jgi:hypothetical protein
MTDRTSVALPDPLADDLKSHKREDQTWPAFVREDVLSALEGETDTVNADDLAARIVDQLGADVGGAQVDDSEIARAVARELDYAHLADRVSEQVVREMGGR